MLDLADDTATRAAGARLAAGLRGGDTIALVGDLGAGKTTFVSGLVAALGGGTATSPTFALVQRYQAAGFSIWHVDLYRLERDSEVPELGLDDLIGDPTSVVIIEWADRFDVMPPDHLRIDLAHTISATGGRTLSASGSGPRGRALADLLASQP